MGAFDRIIDCRKKHFCGVLVAHGSHASYIEQDVQVHHESIVRGTSSSERDLPWNDVPGSQRSIVRGPIVEAQKAFAKPIGEPNRAFLPAHVFQHRREDRSLHHALGRFSVGADVRIQKVIALHLPATGFRCGQTVALSVRRA